MTHINPYLRFNGNCREAMTFYQACLGGELALQTIGDSPLVNEMPADAHQNILHSTLVQESVSLMGSDMAGPEGLVHGTAVAMSITCSSEEEIRTIFSKLAAGGHITDPLDVKFWGGMFGVITDQFGNEWMLSYDKPKE